MERFALVVLFVVAFAGCNSSAGSPVAPTPEQAKLSTQIAANIFATLTASVPSATSTPVATNTPVPTDTPRATDTPLPTSTPTQTNTSVPTSTPKPTDTPKPVPTAVPKQPPVGQDQLVHLSPAWDVTLISVRRDKGVFFYDNGDIAMGIYASFLFRVKNLQSGSATLGNSFGFQVRADGSAPIYHELFNTYEYKARWFYSCCIDAFDKLGPGEENVVLITFDVPEGAKSLSFYFTPTNPFEWAVPVIGPEFSVPNFDQIPPRKGK